MKKLLEDCLEVIQRGFSAAHDPTLYTGLEERMRLADRLRAALSAYQPNPSPEMMALCAADGLEDKGDWRAETIRELMCETPDVAKVLASIKADGAEGYCTIRHTGGGNYTISALPVSDVAMTFAVSDGCPWVPDADQ